MRWQLIGILGVAAGSNRLVVWHHTGHWLWGPGEHNPCLLTLFSCGEEPRAQLGTPSRNKWLGLRLNYLILLSTPHENNFHINFIICQFPLAQVKWIIRLPIIWPDLSVESVIIITFLPASLLWRFINEVGFLGFFRLFRLSCASTNVLEKVTPKSTLSEQPDHWKVNKHVNECCPESAISNPHSPGIPLATFPSGTCRSRSSRALRRSRTGSRREPPRRWRWRAQSWPRECRATPRGRGPPPPSSQCPPGSSSSSPWCRQRWEASPCCLSCSCWCLSWWHSCLRQVRALACQTSECPDFSELKIKKWWSLALCRNNNVNTAANAKFHSRIRRKFVSPDCQRQTDCCHQNSHIQLIWSTSSVKIC